MGSRRNNVGDDVYVKDSPYEWLPASVLEIDIAGDNALVQIKLPENWKQTTILHPVNEAGEDSLSNSQRWVKLNDYPRGKLPFRSKKLVRDMADIPHLHEASMLYQVKMRHSCQKPYTRVGEIVVAVNPCQWIPDLYTDDVQKAYARNLVWGKGSRHDNKPSSSSCEEKKDDDDAILRRSTEEAVTGFGGEYDRAGYDPHVYEVSALAYSGIAHRNQAILVSGESGAGKTETVKIVLKHLARLPEWQPGQQTLEDVNECSQSLVDQIMAGVPIFEAFGNSKTRRNHNSSRFGKVTKLHFSLDESSQAYLLKGATTDTYLLEKSRVVSHSSGESNFHIFYQMLSASPDVKEELLGSDWKQANVSEFRYLVSTTQDTSNVHVGELWEDTLKALKRYGWKGKALKVLMQAIGIILRFGNLTFEYTREETVAIREQEELALLSAELSLPGGNLESVLTSKKIKANDEELVVPHSATQAKEACDSLVKILYSRIFAALVGSINAHTNGSENADGKRTIALFDMFGFESFEKNGFEQLCVNYASERLQYKYVQDNLLRLTAEYEAEGISLIDINSIDNSRTVSIFEKANGILNLLNDECLRRNGTDENFVSRLKQANPDLCDKKIQSETNFRIAHFAGPVDYDAVNFIERNSDKVSRNLLAAVAETSNILIRRELSSVIHDEESESQVKKRKTSIMQSFKAQLQTLLATMDNSETRYIRCIKPNDKLIPNRLEHAQTLKQIRCSGLVTAIELSRQSFPDRLSFELIEDRYFILLAVDVLRIMREMPLHDRVCLALTFLFSEWAEGLEDTEFGLPYVCGKTTVFFKAGAVEHVESLRTYLYAMKATKLQAWYRSHRQHSCFHSNLKSIICIQNFYRSKKQRNLYLTVQRGICRLQGQFWAVKARQMYRHKLKAVVAIQNTSRTALSRQYLNNRRKAVGVLQRFSRVSVATSRYRRTLKAVVAIQNISRVALSRQRFNKYKKAVSNLQRFSRMLLATHRYRMTKKAILSIQRVLRGQFVRSKLRGSKHSYINEASKNHVLQCSASDTLVIAPQGSGFLSDNGKQSEGPETSQHLWKHAKVCWRCNKVDEENSASRDRIRELKQEIVQVTEEADLHKQMVEAEYEDRLADYEAEVIELQHHVADLRMQNSSLKTEMKTAQNNYMYTVQLLQRGIRDTTDSHKEYLAKITSQLERSNEHRKAETAKFAQELNSMKKARDATIHSLKAENEKMRKDSVEQKRLRKIVLEGEEQVPAEINQLARKLEKLISSESILSVVDDASRHRDRKISCVEKLISSKCRKVLYRLEDIVVYSVTETSSNNKQVSNDEVVGLQNQLVRAYEEIEQLKEELSIVKSMGRTD